MKLLTTIMAMALFISQSMAATYEVPVADGLKEFATFKLENFVKRIDGETITVSYKLPVVLTGNEENIVLTGKVVSEGSDVILQGLKGIAICKSPVYEDSVCSVEYFNLKFNQEKAINEITSISKSAVEQLARIEVMSSFSTDPVGIIKY